MALLCGLWLPGIWGLQQLLPAVGGVPTAAAWPVLGGGVLLLLLGALFLGLSLRIEQARLRAALRSALRGESVQPLPRDWKELLDDVREAMRDGMRERAELAQRAVEAEQAQREQAEQAARAADAAQQSLLQLQQQLQRQTQEWRELLPLLPDAAQARERTGTLERGAQALRDARQQAQALRGGIADASAALAQAAGEGEQDSRALLQRSTRLAESLQLLGLNFRLLLERLQLLPAARGEGLDALVQDLEPLCQQATALFDALQQAERQPNPGPERARDALQALATASEALLAALQQGDAELDQAQAQAQAAAVHDLRGLLERSLAAQAPA